jgi:hypothetical protein
MPLAAFNSDPVEAAYSSAALRAERARQRRELRSLPPREALARIVDPPYELGTLPLEKLFVPIRQSRRPIPAFGFAKFAATIRLLQSSGHSWAQPRVRLGDLSRTQRELLASAILVRGPRKWRAAA